MSNEETESNEEFVEEDLNEDSSEELDTELATVEEDLEKAEEEAKPEEKSEKKEEEDIVEERVYTIPLGKVWISPRKKHSPKAVRMLKQFITKHMKVDADSIRINNAVNEKIWERGIEKPPRKIRVRVTKSSEDIVTVHLAEGK